MNLMILLRLFCLFELQTSTTCLYWNWSSASYKQKRQSCSPSVGIRNCNRKAQNYMYTHYLYVASVEVNVGCAGNSIESVTWIIKNLQNNNEDKKKGKKYSSRILPADVFKPGKYELAVQAKESNGGTTGDKCAVEFLPSSPGITFSQGDIQYIILGKTATISSLITGDAVPQWLATCSNRPSPICRNRACPRNFQGSSVSVAYDACFISVKLVATANIIGKSFSSSHVVRLLNVVDVGLPIAEVECSSNCGDGVDIEKASEFTCKCKTRCSNFDKLTLQWRVEDGQGGNIGNLQTSNKKLTISANSLTLDRKYYVTCHSADMVESIKSMTTRPNSVRPNCNISPTSGTSLDTVFRISCAYSAADTPLYSNFLQTYMHASNYKLLLVETSYLEYDVILPYMEGAEGRLEILGHNIYYKEMEPITLNVQVNKASLTEANVKIYVKKVEKNLLSRDLNVAIQVAQALLIGFESQKVPQGSRHNAIKSIAVNLKKAKLATLSEYKYALNILPFLYTELHGDYKEDVCELCRTLSKTSIASMMKSRYSKLQEEDAQTLYQNINNCMSKCLEDIKTTPDDTKVHLTEPPLLVTEKVIKEDYPHYDDVPADPNIEKLKPKDEMERVEEVADAIVSGLPNNKHYETKQPNFQTKVITTKQPKNGFTMDGVNVGVNTHRPNEDITIAVTSFPNNRLNTTKYKVATNILNVDAVNVGKMPVKPLGGVKVWATLDVIRHIDNFTEHTARASSDRSTWTWPQIDYDMNVHRAEAFEQQDVGVDFQGIDVHEKLQIALTTNRRPTLEDFRANLLIIDGARNRTSFTYKRDFRDEDAYVYVGVLPHTAIIENQKAAVNYSIQIGGLECVAFNSTSRHWIPQKTTVKYYMLSGKHKMACSYPHTTLYAGRIHPLKNKLDEPLKMEFTTTYFENWIVFGHVAVVFLCYCLALCFLRLRRKIPVGIENVFFLGDNLKNDYYAYLLEVKTGSIAYSGTTSNVCVRLFGEKQTSKPHVLNYPDPEKQLLQKDKMNWFILASDRHLGNIQELHVWFDSIGLRPSWYCEYVVIIDLQTQEKWFFNIETWFSLDKTTIAFHKFKSSQENQKSYAVKKNLEKNLRLYFNGSNTWNIFDRSHDNSLTYHQRLLVLLSMIYTTYITCFWLLSFPHLRRYDEFGHGSYLLTAEIVYVPIVSAIASSSINLTFVYFFRNSEKKIEIVGLHREDEIYSHKVSKIIWCTVILWIIICMLYLIVFGFWMTLWTSYLWIICTILSILLSVFVVELLFWNLYNVLRTKYFQVRAKYYNFLGILVEVERQRRALFRLFGEYLLRQYFLKHYRPLSRSEILFLAEKEKNRAFLRSLLTDFIIFLIYLLALFLLILINMDDMRYISNRQIRRMIEQANFDEDLLKLQDVRSVQDIYEYINTTVVLATHPINWYGMYYTKDPGSMVDFSNKVLGVIQLRQQRRRQSCRRPRELQNLSIGCKEENPIFEEMDYNSGKNISAAVGELSIYSGSGYIIHLGRNLYNSYYIMNLLKRGNWIDIDTKILFIEFLVYNSNYNCFHAVRIMIERDVTGNLINSMEVFSARLIYSHVYREVISLLLITLFLILMIILITRRVMYSIRYKQKFFKQFWNIFDTILLALTFTVLILFFCEKYMTRDLMEELAQRNHNSFVDYFTLITVARAFVFISAILVCMATIRLWKYMDFSKGIRVVEQTLKRSIGSVAGLALFHLLIMVTWSIYFHTVHGPHCYPFRTYVSTLIMLILYSLMFEIDSFQYNVVWIHNNSIYATFFLFLLIFLLIYTLYTTVILMEYEECKRRNSNLHDSYNLQNYVKDEYAYYRELYRKRYHRLRGGGDRVSEEYVYPKELTERYANVEVISENKLEQMRLIAKAVINKLKGEYDLQLMARIYLSFANPKKDPEMYMYFREIDPDGNKVVLVSDLRLQRMEFIIKLLLRVVEPADEHTEDSVLMCDTEAAKRLMIFEEKLKVFRQVVTGIKIISKRS